MKRRYASALLAGSLALSACHERPDRDTVVIDIESSPTNLDIRIGSDAQSEHIGGLIFDSIVRKDEHYNLQPAIATAWEWRDPTTLVLHIRDGVRFHDGKLLDATDVAWSIESMHNGTILTAKSGNFASVDHVDIPNSRTCIVHLKRPDASLLFNMSDELSAVVEKGAAQTMGEHPIGSGPYRFVSEAQDQQVTLERNPSYWGGAPSIPRVRFAIVPDAITRALELQNGSADVASNALTSDMVAAMSKDPNLVTESKPGSIVNYMTFNVTDPLLQDVRVRQAFAYSVDRPAIIKALLHGQAEIVDTLLPMGHWAQPGPSDPLAHYTYDVPRAKALLDAAGYPAGPGGIRIHLTLKSSTDDTMRLLATIVQQQVRAAGIDLQLRQNEFGTFYADVTKGAFQIYVLRWVGSNEDPDIFRYAYDSKMMPPKGGNRGHYGSAAADDLISEGAASTNTPDRRGIYVKLQNLLSIEEPTLVLWSPDNVVVHTRRVSGVVPSASGSFAWLRTAILQ
ncbi:MAG: ABC transporter substrate-binding protein [Janthinobacterium lividum]